MAQYKASYSQRQKNYKAFQPKKRMKSYSGGRSYNAGINANMNMWFFVFMLLVLWAFWDFLQSILNGFSTSFNQGQKIVAPAAELAAKTTTTSAGVVSQLMDWLVTPSTPSTALPTDGSVVGGGDDLYQVLKTQLLDNWSSDDDAIVKAFQSYGGGEMIDAFNKFGSPYLFVTPGGHVGNSKLGVFGHRANLFEFLGKEMDAKKFQDVIDSWNANVDQKIV